MKILIDMNLPPKWKTFFSDHNFKSVHWSEIGPSTAKDVKILEYARNNNYIVFTHDLDFSAILSRTRGIGPSIIQVRTQDVTPKAIGRLVLAALREHREEIDIGAIVSVNSYNFRVRILPLQPE
jgi:predicted nuclease of predicted toxin-antitoxin system